MNTLYYGDNRKILPLHVKEESVDLVYLDPPFNSNQDYNVLFAEKSGEKSAAQIKAFEDTWHWDNEAERWFEHVVSRSDKVADLLVSLRRFLGDNDMMAYLTNMAPSLIELRRVMKPTASIYLHCDPTASHYLKLLMDAVFGASHYRNEIIWKRMTPSGFKGKTNIGWSHDVILTFVKSDKARYYPIHVPYSDQYLMERFSKIDEHGRRFKDEKIGTATSQATINRLKAEGRIYVTKAGKLRIKHYLEDAVGIPLDDVWYDIPPVNSQAAERLGYPTQKPEALLERIIKASSNEGDVVLDPFCGCGTATAVSQRLKRKWIGIDITHLAITLIKKRLFDSFGKRAKYEVVGEPEDLAGAKQLAADDKYQFQWWALGLDHARPTEQKKGADRGIDGRRYFVDHKNRKTEQILYSVKGGHVGVKDVRDLRGVLEREKAAFGVLITLERPTRDMRKEAAAAGLYHSDYQDTKHPRLQIATIEELLDGKQLDFPALAKMAAVDVTFKKAPKDRGEKSENGELEL